jgi:hypothetical protein
VAATSITSGDKGSSGGGRLLQAAAEIKKNDKNVIQTHICKYNLHIYKRDSSKLVYYI